MVETIEYSLVVLTSILFAGSGVYLFTNYTQRVSQTDASATFSSILSAAYSSLASNSERRVVLFLSNATISCQGGTVVFESGPSRVAATIPAGGHSRRRRFHPDRKSWRCSRREPPGARSCSLVKSRRRRGWRRRSRKRLSG